MQKEKYYKQIIACKMKTKSILHLLSLCMLAHISNKAYSMVDTVRIDGIRYELRVEGEDYSCKVLNSEDTVIYKKYGNKVIDYEKYSYYEGDIVIPETVRHNGMDYKVTGISEYAFAFCTEMKSVRLPASLTFIGIGAFSGCLSLEDIVIPNSVIHIGASALTNCKNLKSVQLSTSLDTIPEGLFFCCSQLKEVEIPEGVVYVGHSAFAYCHMLEKIFFPRTLKKIGNVGKKYFQFDCPSLANVYIRSESAPLQDYYRRETYYENWDYEPENLFQYVMPCVLHVPEGSAEDYASAEGWNYFHSTVEFDPETGSDYSYSLDDDVRFWNKTYSSYKVPENSFIIDGISYIVLSEEERTCSVVASRIFYHDDNYVIPEKITYEGMEYTVVSLSHYAFSGCISVKKVSLPETIKEISDGCFSNNYSIESLRLPAAVERIDISHLVSLNELIVEASSFKFSYSVYPGIYNIDDIYLLHADNPEQVSLEVGASHRKIKPRLHVPEHALSSYESNSSFSKNWTLVGISPDDPLLKVKSVTEQCSRSELHYGIDGRAVDANAPGLHIIRMPDNSMRKALILSK